ncbi:hypothetical protein COX84_04975 [Candidatus Micrarchaeota archaeon CG_4_10_14_0_2_um_filter_49_7]|nr:MAG: hypothetical protein AUJ13_05900 [Candidatus Micrarchaeota archaeon CG1_02_49_24]PIZ94745.1 MAG: hypothetical protein COX84_04975 [Candidatus Micrarchaeota archaeon CG_4_10_14_0_2_um_filter_49_7]HII53889.1 hypothetical protein [Candidatus Micrarchaeota archaeon]
MHQAVKKNQTISEGYKRTAEQSEFFANILSELKKSKHEFLEIAPEKESFIEQSFSEKECINKALSEGIMVESEARAGYEREVKRAKKRMTGKHVETERKKKTKKKQSGKKAKEK